MDPSLLDVPLIRYVNLLDYPEVPHAPGSFEAIAMAFDPLLRESEARELGDFLADSRGDYYGQYLVTSRNAVGCGHAYPMNQLYFSGSVAILAGSDTPVILSERSESKVDSTGEKHEFGIYCFIATKLRLQLKVSEAANF